MSSSPKTGIMTVASLKIGTDRNTGLPNVFQRRCQFSKGHSIFKPEVALFGLGSPARSRIPLDVTIAAVLRRETE